MSSQLSVRNEIADLPSQQAAHAIAGTIEQLKAVRTFVQNEFVQGVDYGKIPGCGDKPTLFLPGAQKATMYFNCYPTYKVQERDLGNGHVSIRVRCLLVSRASREQAGEGIGCCSTMEKKYRWRGNEILCPSCKAPAIRKSKDKPEYYCWRKINGCGAIFGLKEPAIASQGGGVPVENPDLYDLHNTILKMAKKRAHVDATMTLACLSELFTQDIEDTFGVGEVIDAARPYEGEVAEEPEPARFKSAPGLSTKDHKANVVRFLAWLGDKCDASNAKWQKSWKPIVAAALEDGHEVPAKIPDAINKFQAKNHLWKWAVAAGRIEGVTDHRGAVASQVEAYLARIWVEDEPIITAEMGAYVLDERRALEAKIFAKHPEIAPDGYEPPVQEPAPEVEAEAGADSWPEGRL